jgi:adenylate kinase
VNLILFGPPGVGKGTQAEKLRDKYKLHHISTGDILRSAVKQGTKLGKEAKRYMDSGGLVPDEVIIAMVKEVLEWDIMTNRGFLLDGFPRTEDQAQALEKIFRQLKIEDVRIISLTAPDEELIKRLIKRGKESGRSDDTAETIRHRLVVYQKQTSPVLDFYQSRHKVRSIDGLGSIVAITRRINEAIKNSEPGFKPEKKKPAAKKAPPKKPNAKVKPSKSKAKAKPKKKKA